MVRLAAPGPGRQTRLNRFRDRKGRPAGAALFFVPPDPGPTREPFHGAMPRGPCPPSIRAGHGLLRRLCYRAPAMQLFDFFIE